VSSACCVVGRVRGLLPDGILITFVTPMRAVHGFATATTAG
jgi:hypothetical protein